MTTTASLLQRAACATDCDGEAIQEKAMSEYYTHLLISASKTYRPSAHAVCQFLEEMVQRRAIGQDHHLRVAKVVKKEPRSRKIRNPFTRRIQRERMPTRRRQYMQGVSAVSQVVALVEHEQEYDVSVVSTVPPAHPPLEIGGVDENGVWQPWEAPYDLEIRCRVRDALVYLCDYRYDPKSGESRDRPNLEIWIQWFDEDCAEGALDGFFLHPWSSTPIRIPNAGCGRFWVEFRYGKWLYPRSTDGGITLLDLAVTRLASRVFGTPFVEACSWG